MSSIIPLEIVDDIIGQLHFETAALKACSLVCRAWLPSCRYHLFRGVSLDFSVSPNNGLHRFLTQLENPQSALLSYLQKLALDSASSRIEGDLLSRLASLQRIEELKLSRILSFNTWKNITPTGKAVWLNSLHTVKHVHISDSSIALPHLVGFIAHVPFLESFSLARISLRFDLDLDIEKVLNRDTLPHLRKLHFGLKSFGVAPAICRLISSGVVVGRIQTLQVDELELQSVPMLSALLNILKPSLKHLTISAKDNLGGSRRVLVVLTLTTQR
jgi:hypothetical protein